MTSAEKSKQPLKKTDKILSIRLSPDGLSFWSAKVSIPETEAHGRPVPDYKTEKEEKYVVLDNSSGGAETLRQAFVSCRAAVKGNVVQIRLYPDTLKHIAFPAEFSPSGQIENYLKINNITPDAAQSAEVAYLSEDAGALVIVDSAVLDAAREVFGETLCLMSPWEINLSYPNRYRKHADKDRYGLYTALYLTGTNVYITIAVNGSAGMKYCEVMPYSSEADILYYTGELAGHFNIAGKYIYIKGPGSRQIAKSLRKQFKKAVCV